MRGRTGSLDSVGGTEPSVKIREYLSRIPDWSKDSWAHPVLSGVVIDLDRNGKTQSIRRVRHECGDPPKSEVETREG